MIEGLGRRGKYLLLALDGNRTLVMHLRMTGNLVLVEGEDRLDPSEGMRLYEGERSTSERHLRARFALEDGRELWFTDPRRFGEAFLIDDADLEARFERLGVEPFSDDFTAEALAAMSAGRTAPLKSFLLDQSGVAGVGNIYADEALFRARLHPLSPAGSMRPEHHEALRDAVVAALEAGIDRGGASIDDYRDGRGEKGTMQDEFLVHTREGEPCPSCGEPIARIVVSGRSTYYCRALPGPPAQAPPAPPSGPSFNLGCVAGKTLKTEAVVLRSIRFGEADRILHLYSANRGRIGAIAKGARRPKSRFGGRLEPFFRLDLVLHEGRGELLTVTNVATVDGYPRLRSSGAGAGRRRPRLRRGPAPARLGRAQPTRLQPALPLPGVCSTIRRRSGRRRWRRRSPSGSSWRWRLASRPSWPPAPAAARPSTWSASPAPRGESSAPAARRAPSRSPRRRTASWSRRSRSRSPRRRWPRSGSCARWSGRWARRWSTTRTCSCAPRRRIGAVEATVDLEGRVRAWEAEFLSEHATPSYPARRLRRGARQPAAHTLPARPRPDRALEGVPAAQAQDPGLHRPRGRPLPHPPHPHARGLRDRSHGSPRAGAERGSDRGDRPRPRPRPPALRPHRRGGARRSDCASACGGGFKHNVHSLRVVDVLEREGQGLNLTEQVRDGILNHTGPDKPATLEGRDRQAGRPGRLHQPRHRRRAAGGDPAPGRPARSGDRAARADRLGADRHPGARHRRALGREPADIVQSEEVGGAMLRLRKFMFERVYLGAGGAHASTSGPSAPCAASSTTTWSTRRRCRRASPGRASASASPTTSPG